jgi:glutamate synthase (NADPH/NADH) small chain
MGKPTGFMEYSRKNPDTIKVENRIKHWEEFYEYLPEDEQREQASRCMDCGVPFCHSGMMLNNMVSGCPLNNLIPEWNDLIYKGLDKEAYYRLTKTNNFPEFTGRVCPAPCEGACTEGLYSEPVTIKYNEYYIIEKAFANSWIKPTSPKNNTGKKVAVIGSGPSGLACADQLRSMGHEVTVYERSDRCGGLLMYGIPNMKLDKKKVVERRLDLMKEQGVKFITGVEVSKDISYEELKSNYDAIVLCCGATAPRDLDVPGRKLNGIYFAVDFLKANTKSLLDSDLKDKKYIDAKDKDVVVIGGGDTGTDCVATSIRHGCKSVVQLEILPCQPETRTENNPWPQFPKILKVDYGQVESEKIFGKDPREYCVMTKKFVGDKVGNIKELHTVKIEWKVNEQGRFIPVEIPGTEKVYSAQLVLLALGFLGPEENIIKEFGINNYRSFQTDIEGVFSAGDMRRGQSLVVWAIKEGRDAAIVCDKYLRTKNEG